MKLIIPIVALVTLLSNARQCQSFLPQSRFLPETASSSRTRLQNMLLILEEHDDDEDSDKKKGSQAAGSDFDKNGGQPQEIHLIVDGPMGLGGALSGMGLSAFAAQPQSNSRALVDEWKEKFVKTPAPPLTAMRRARLEKEISLLEKLASGDYDEATIIKELSSMWINESGPDAARAIEIAGGLANGGALGQAEIVLKLIIEEEGLHFVQPLNEMAALYAVMGRLKESKDLCALVLEQKPWHFGALDTMHSVCRALDDDYEELIKWDRELMPPLADRDGKDKRVMWAKRMLEKAKAKLSEQEQNLHGFFDRSYDKSGSDGSVLLDDEDSWQ